VRHGRHVPEKAYRACAHPYPFDYHVIDLATLFYTWSLVAGEPWRPFRCAKPRSTGRSSGPVFPAHSRDGGPRLTLETFRHYSAGWRCGRLSDAPGGAAHPGLIRSDLVSIVCWR
jgi:hypothetical protein